MGKYLLILFLFTAAGISAQMHKADAYAAEGNYTKAIPLYKKEAASDDPALKLSAFTKLANAYMLVGQSVEAEKTYEQLLESGQELPAEIHYEYAQALKANMKYDEATKQYNKFIKLKPGDQRTDKVRKLCAELNYYNSQSAQYTVSNLTAINTIKSEFSPFVWGNKLLYTGELSSHNFDNYKFRNEAGSLSLAIYVADLEGVEAKKPRQFSKSLTPSNQQDGPACLSADGQFLYFTRTGEGKTKPAIYVASAPNWKQAEAIHLAGPDHLAAHPSINPGNNELYFTSDMPGGYGGKDIWMSEKKDNVWSTPVNLGPDVNTQGDEMFPAITRNGILYFSSNGLPGFGGLDIYSAKKIQNVWMLQRNEGLGLNSNKDDFGITFLNDTTGYFSSNRPGTKGDDDIYRFTYRDRSRTISGHVLLTANLKDYARYRKLLLIDKNGAITDSTVTDTTGRFVFKVLDSEKNYLVSVEESDPALQAKARYYYSYNDSIVQRVTTRFQNRHFVFRNIPGDARSLPDLYTEDDLVLAGTLQYGDKSTALANTRIRITNEFGDVVEETRTNEYGSFAFRKIPSDQNYLISIVESDIELPEGTAITLLNKGGKTLKVFYKEKEKFNFKILSTDVTLLQEMRVEDVDLVMELYGYIYSEGNIPIASANIRVTEEGGTGYQVYATDSRGRFNFKNLDPEKNYVIEADASDPAFGGLTRVFLADSKGRIYKIIEIAAGKFQFKILEVDKFMLGEFVADDPWLMLAELRRDKTSVEKTPDHQNQDKSSEDPDDLSITIIENIYYAFGDHKLSASAEAILNKAVHALKDNPDLIMEISSHTDSKSSDEFNMKLSKKRAQTAMDYIVKNGVSKSRLKATGYGESKLLNECKNDVPCTEEQHEKNRRTEFKFTKAEAK